MCSKGRNRAKVIPVFKKVKWNNTITGKFVYLTEPTKYVVYCIKTMNSEINSTSRAIRMLHRQIFLLTQIMEKRIEFNMETDSSYRL